jgi:hypothetical protein
MRAGQFPYRRGARVAPPPHALALEVLPPELRRLAWRTFTTGVRRPSARPTSAAWVAALERADDALRTCDRSIHHVFGAHLRRCPWCARLDGGLPDPFPGPTGRSSLERRPPPRSVRVRAAAGASVRAGGAWVMGIVGRAGTAAGRWVWGRVRGPLAWTIPAALTAALALALVPVPALALLVLGALSSSYRSGRARTWLRWRGPPWWPWLPAAAGAVVHVVHGPWWWPLS